MQITTAQALIMETTAAHTTGAQDEALDIVTDRLDAKGRANPYPATPDARYGFVQAACDFIPDYELLAARIAGALNAPLEDGLAGDPLTQMLHDVFSEAQAEAEAEYDRQVDDEADAAMEEAEARARWNAMCDADLAARDEGY